MKASVLETEEVLALLLFQNTMQLSEPDALETWRSDKVARQEWRQKAKDFAEQLVETGLKISVSSSKGVKDYLAYARTIPAKEAYDLTSDA